MTNLKNLTKTPLLLGVIALSPALFVTTSLELALVYGIVFLVALLAFFGLSKLLDKFIEPRFLFPAYAFTILILITIIEITLDLALPLLIANAGLYVSLIAAELLFIFESKEEEFSFMSTLKFGLLLLAGLVLTGFMREFLSTYNILIGQVLPIKELYLLPYGKSNYGLTLMSQPAGGFIVIGLLLGVLSIFQKEDNLND